jgi:hypothetical protein
MVFIGLFSVADDEGKGRSKPVYVKSTIFPYDEDLRVSDIEKALSEIGTKMSVTFYSHGGNEYYRLDHWAQWQRVDKPTPSKIPDPESFPTDSGITPESFSTDSCLKEKKRKEDKVKEEKGREDGAPAAPPPPTDAEPERPKVERHRHGKYGWALLSDAELERLYADHGR